MKRAPRLQRPLRVALAAAVSAALLSACQTGPKPLYDWGPYQGQVYAQFKGTGNGPEAQIQELERHLAETTGKQRRVPPGYLAHLGYLYLQVGRNDQAAAYWEREKAAFPESTAFMDFLLKNLNKQGG